MLKKLISIILLIMISACSTPQIKQEKKEKETTPPFSDYIYPAQNVKLWLGKSASYDIKNNNKLIKTSAGESSLSKSDLTFIADSNYRVSFSLSSNDKVEVNINLTYDGITLIDTSVELNKEEKNFSYTFKPTTKAFDGVFTFSFKGPRALVTLKDFLIQNLDEQNIGVRINQLGFLPQGQKQVTFSSNAGDTFFLLDKQNKIVYRSNIFNAVSNEINGEYNSQGDFTNFKNEGTYKIVSEVGTSSNWFAIGENIYDDLKKSVLKFFTLQRSGIDLSEEVAGKLAHPASHTDLARVYGWGGKEVDVSGGWYDAGDYGRYLQTGIKALTSLLLSYYLQSNNNDNFDIVESHNNKPDILDEAAHELKWLLKMVNPQGLPYNKLTTKHFADIVAPQDDKQQLYCLPPTNLTSNSFVGVMALASVIYKDYDLKLANNFKKAALRIKDVINYPSQPSYKNPSEFTTGQYDDDSDIDEKYFACASLYLLTHQQKYADLAYKYYLLNVEGSSVANMYDYGSAILLTTLDRDTNFYKLLEKDIRGKANYIQETLEKSSYPYPLKTYQWGSNQHVSEAIFTLQLAYYCFGDNKYLKLATMCLNYILGQNANDKCFVVGYGYNYPNNPHSRLAKVSGGQIVGALVGGANQYLTEDIKDTINELTPLAKRYCDDFDSYSSNEVALTYNGALFLALNVLDLFNKK